MKVLATQGFNEKFSSLGDANFRNSLLRFIESINNMDDITKIIRLSSVGLDSIYVYRLDNYRIFFSIENDDSGNDYMLLVDFITKGYGTQTINNKNPRINNSINPRINNSINPRINNSINPRINNSINPRINNSINPRINNSINPRINNSINPRINNSINPRINNSINPRINNSINPRINPSYQGLYVFDMDLNQKEFIVQANDTVIQFYDFNLTNTRFGVRHPNNGYVLFDLSNNWIGHLESDSQNGYNEFDSNNNWIGIVK